MKIPNFLVLAVVGILVGGCLSSTQQIRVGVRADLRFSVQIVTFDRLRLLLQATGHPYHKNALSTWRRGKRAGTCTIYITPPIDEHDLTWHRLLYHEMRHCQDGKWHPRAA